MTKIYKKKYQEANVYEAALSRIEYLYNTFDDVVVSFSGGKDSTAMLLCCIDVAVKLDRLPVHAVFYDEEAIHPPTIDYVRRVSNMETVNLEWVCLPIKHRNACSNSQPFWHCWHPDEKDVWIRELPPEGIIYHDRFVMGQSMQEFGIAHFKNTNKVVIQGIRTEESLRRYRAVAMKKNENYISKPDKGVYFAYPIYDWTSDDVWRLVKIKDADYNRTYDIFNRTDQYGMLLKQRVCPPYGEEPLRGLYIYAECFPEMWEKMINRVAGAATAARYGNTEIYSTGYKPEQTSWRLHIQNIMEQFDGEYRKMVTDNVNAAIRYHKNKTDDPIPEYLVHPVSGASWQFLSKMVTRGDFKGRVIQMLSQQSTTRLNGMGITLDEAISMYGKHEEAK